MSNEILRIEDRVRRGVELSESHFREFKSAFEQNPTIGNVPRTVKSISTDISETLVAFANADGGELFVGVEDDGTISGVPHTEEKIALMIDSWRSHIHSDTPLLPPTARIVELDGKKILYFYTTKGTSSVHLTSSGRCLQRYDRGNKPVSAEHVQFARREQASREYDRAFLPAATVQDLNLTLLESVAAEVAPGFSAEKLLQFLNLGEYSSNGLQLRRAALLLFAKDIIRWHPRCEVRIFRVAGTEILSGEKYNVVEDEIVRGNILEIIETAWDVLRPHLARTKFQPSALFRESIIYPEPACREALTNAIAHRDYSSEGEPIEVIVYDDRMEVRSPGALLSSVTIAELQSQKRAHESRNVLVARVLKELGHMLEMGEGMLRIYQSIREFELVDPQLRSENGSFYVVLHHRSVFSPRDIVLLQGYEDFNLDKQEQKVVLLGRDSRLLSTSEIIKTLGIVDTEDFRSLYEGLRRKGIIYSSQPKKAGRSRDTPRFKIRTPIEANQYLQELRDAVLQSKATHFSQETEKSVSKLLSPNSPYREKPHIGLIALGLISVSRQFLPSLIVNRPTATVIRMPRQEVVKANSAGTLIGEKTASVTRAVIDRGFAFAKSDDGEEFYLHVANFTIKSDFESLGLGDKLSFFPVEAEHGKLRTGRKIHRIAPNPGGPNA